MALSMLEGEGSKRVKASEVEQLPDGEEGDSWKDAMGEELNSLEQPRVHDAVNRGEIARQHWSKRKTATQLPPMLVLVIMPLGNTPQRCKPTSILCVRGT